MRPADLAPPAITPHVLPPEAPMARWPYQLRIALERLPQAAYTWDDADPDLVWDAAAAGYVPGYLTPTVGTVTTPDPGVLPNQHVYVCKVRGPTGGEAYDVLAAQCDNYNQYSWRFERTPSGIVNLTTFATGQAGGSVGASAPTVPSAGDQTIALAVTLNNGNSQRVVTAWSHDGTAWVSGQSRTVATGTVFDSTDRIRIGAWNNGSSGVFRGRIYSVELRAGLDPAAGETLWRFDADEYPGSGTVYTDPRGRTWTLTAAAAITPKVPAEALYVWDAPFIASGFTDSLCDLISLTIDPGDLDELGLLPPTEVTLTLANPDGAYTVWTADGRLTYWAPGKRIAVWAVDVDTDEAFWLFGGRVASWTLDPAGTVTVVAFDGLANLADELGADWTPGTGGQLPLARIQAVAAQTGYLDTIRGDAGDNALSTAVTDVSPLEACQGAALSDGGIFAGDADGALIYRNRLWRAGRDDQGVVPIFSDNVCDAPLIVWDPLMAADDEGLYTRVELVNAAGLTAVAALPAGDPAAWWTGTRYRLTHPDPDLWQTQLAGDTLAGYLLAQQSTPAMAVRAFTLHLHDLRYPQLFPVAVDLRRGDLAGFVSDFVDANGDPARLDVRLVVAGVRHEITAETWTVTVSGTRTVDHDTVEQWDRTLFVWDDADPAAVWRF